LNPKLERSRLNEIIVRNVSSSIASKCIMKIRSSPYITIKPSNINDIINNNSSNNSINSSINRNSNHISSSSLFENLEYPELYHYTICKPNCNGCIFKVDYMPKYNYNDDNAYINNKEQKSICIQVFLYMHIHTLIHLYNNNCIYFFTFKIYFIYTCTLY
jgi:hypothetical protein